MKFFVLLIAIASFVLIVRILLFYATQARLKPGDTVKTEYTFLSEPKSIRGQDAFFVNGVYVYAPPQFNFHYGDIILVSGVIKAFSSHSSGQPPLLVVDKPHIVQLHNWESSALHTIYLLRSKIEQSFKSVLPAQEAGLLLGITFGITSSIPSASYVEIRNAGVLHVIAASGMNVTMFGGFLLGVLTGFINRKVATILTILGILFYAVFSGLQPSIVRASIMGVFSYGALLFGRQNYSYLSLFAACFCMIFIQPDVITNAGFQLSVGSTLGILSIKPLLDTLIAKKQFVLLEDITTTLASQIATLPILIINFSSYSIVSLLTNVLVLWTVPVLMIFGSLAALAALFTTILAAPFLWISYPLLVFFEAVVSFFSRFQILQLSTVPVIMVIGYYCILGAAMLWKRGFFQSKP